MAEKTKRKRAATGKTRAKEEKLKKLHSQSEIAETPAAQVPMRIDARKELGDTIVTEHGDTAALIPKGHIYTIKRAGIDVEEAGALQVANGYCIVTKSALSTVLGRVVNKIENADTEMTDKLAKATASCANAMAKMLGEFRQTNAMKKPDGRPKTPSFVPATMVVQGSVHFHNHDTKEK